MNQTLSFNTVNNNGVGKVIPSPQGQGPEFDSWIPRWNGENQLLKVKFSDLYIQAVECLDL